MSYAYTPSLLVAILRVRHMASGPCSCSRSLLLVVAMIYALLLPCAASAGLSCRLKLTAGFSRIELSESQLVVQKPYDVPLDERYDPCGGVRRMWVFATDKPTSSTHSGGARTKIKVDKICSSGVWQFEGDMYVPWRTSGASVMQVFGVVTHATTLMLHVYDGNLTYYHDLTKVVADRVYDRWIRLNVIHDVAAKVTVFVNGEKRLEAPGQGGKDH